MEEQQENQIDPLVSPSASSGVDEADLAQPTDVGEAEPMLEGPGGQGVNLGSETAKVPLPAEGPAEPAPVILPVQSKKTLMAALFQKFKEKMFARKQARLEKILQLANKKKEINVGEVRELLIVSDSTALRYLNQLVREGKLKRSWKSVGAKYEVL